MKLFNVEKAILYGPKRFQVALNSCEHLHHYGLIDRAIVVADPKMFELLKPMLESARADFCAWTKVQKDLKGLIKSGGKKIALIMDPCYKLKTCSQIRTAAFVRAAKNSHYLFLLTDRLSQLRPLDLYTSLKLCGGHKLNLDAYKERYCGGFRLPGKTFVSVKKDVVTNKDEFKTMINKCIINMEV